MHMYIAEARVRHDLARLGQPGAVAAGLAALAERTDGTLVTVLAADAAALAGAAPGTSKRPGTPSRRWGLSLLAAEAYLAAAAAYRPGGLARPASVMTKRAGELAARCGDAGTPGLSFGANEERLTRREREVAGLAAAGRSSREIAAKLVLSVRTVDKHLQNAPASRA